MRVSETPSEDSSTLDCQDLNSVDESEAYGLLASLGKRYYKSVGMGKSLEIEKLRQLHGRWEASSHTHIAECSVVAAEFI